MKYTKIDKDRIKELEEEENLKIKKEFVIYLIIYFISFILVPLFLGPYLIMYFESDFNKNLNNYSNAFSFTYEVITGIDMIDTNVLTIEGKMLSGFFGLTSLIFFGFIVSVITITLEMIINNRRTGRRKRYLAVYRGLIKEIFTDTVPDHTRSLLLEQKLVELQALRINGILDEIGYEYLKMNIFDLIDSFTKSTKSD